ncbi:MAG: hypothetical protein METHAR1v1_780005 [Methanothrix sp.]|nr:MAG: hypothetical protein METHAR1v1_780005 [Methanothrix sp.]
MPPTIIHPGSPFRRVLKCRAALRFMIGQKEEAHGCAGRLAGDRRREWRSEAARWWARGGAAGRARRRWGRRRRRIWNAIKNISS